MCVCKSVKRTTCSTSGLSSFVHVTSIGSSPSTLQVSAMLVVPTLSGISEANEVISGGPVNTTIYLLEHVIGHLNLRL